MLLRFSRQVLSHCNVKCEGICSPLRLRISSAIWRALPRSHITDLLVAKERGKALGLYVRSRTDTCAVPWCHTNTGQGGRSVFLDIRLSQEIDFRHSRNQCPNHVEGRAVNVGELFGVRRCHSWQLELRLGSRICKEKARHSPSHIITHKGLHAK